MEKISRLWITREIFTAHGDKMCERFEDASVIQIAASYTKILFEDASVIQIAASYTKILYAHHALERHSRAEKNPTMTKIVLLWLLSKTIVNVSYYIVGHVPRTISVPCGLFLKKGGTVSCAVTGPCQPRYSRDLEKLLRDQQREQQHIC